MKNFNRNQMTMAGLVLACACSSAMLFSGCKDNPYPNGQYTENRPARQIVEKAYVIEAPDSVEFSEGVEGAFSVRGIVPPPGSPTITFENLPQGAVYSAKDNSVTWTPSYTAADDPQHPTDNIKLYTVIATVHSTAENKGTTQKTITLKVRDVPRSYKLVNFADHATMAEGTPFTTPLVIDDLDFPAGPFVITGVNMPTGVTFKADPASATTYSINYTPDFDVVDSVQYGSKDLSWTLTVVDPRGRIISVPIVWTVQDTRLDPIYNGPQSLTVNSTDVDFVFIAQDPNLEVEPSVDALPAPFGQLTVNRLNGSGATRGRQAGTQPYQTVHVHWANIPLNEAGKSEDVVFNICVYNSYHTMSLCRTQHVTVNFTFTASPSPAPTAAVLDSVSDLKASRAHALTIYGGSL